MRLRTIPRSDRTSSGGCCAGSKRQVSCKQILSKTERIISHRAYCDKDYELGIPLTFRCATQEAKGIVERSYKLFDPASIEVIEQDARQIKAAKIADVQIKLGKPVVVDAFTEIPEMGRFVLEHAGDPVAGEVIC